MDRLSADRPHPSVLDSLVFPADDEESAADAQAQVDGCANEGEAEVVADTAVQLPAFLDLLHPEHQQPSHDEEHADPDQELDVEHGHREEVVYFLRDDHNRPRLGWCPKSRRRKGARDAKESRRRKHSKVRQLYI